MAGALLWCGLQAGWRCPTQQPIHPTGCPLLGELVWLHPPTLPLHLPLPWPLTLCLRAPALPLPQAGHGVRCTGCTEAGPLLSAGQIQDEG